MVKSLLAIVQQVAGELSLSVPSTVLSSTNSTAQQMKYLAVAACEELLDMHDWQRLVKTYKISTQEGVTSYNLPSDYLRIISSTGYNVTNENRMDGSVSAPLWAQNPENSTFDNYRFRIQGNKIIFAETPSAASQSISFDYVSSNYVVDPGLLILKPEFTLDSDETVFHPRLLTLFIKLKYWENMGQDTGPIAQAFNLALQNAKSTDTPAPRIYLTSSGYVRDNLRLIGT